MSELPYEQQATNRPSAVITRSASEHAYFQSVTMSSDEFKPKQGETNSHQNGKDPTRSHKPCGQVHTKSQTTTVVN